MEQLLEILHNVWYGPDIEGLIKAEPLTGLAIAGIATAGASLLGSIFGGIGAGKRARRAASEKRRLQGKLEGLENSRQPIINPYSDVTSLQGFITDTSNIVSNPYANLSVATQAAEFQAEEADISLANTLDTLRATGASAGGATALAQAALQSKRGISASLEQQEANNEKLRAQGEAKVMAARIAEAQRMQQADILGREFVYGEEERRDMEQLNRLQAQITGQQQAQTAATQGVAAVTGSTIGALQGLGDTVGSTDFATRNSSGQSYSDYKKGGGTASRKDFRGS